MKAIASHNIGLRMKVQIEHKANCYQYTLGDADQSEDFTHFVEEVHRQEDQSDGKVHEYHDASARIHISAKPPKICLWTPDMQAKEGLYTVRLILFEETDAENVGHTLSNSQ